MARLLSRRTFLLTGAAVGGTALVAAVGGGGYLATVDVDACCEKLINMYPILNYVSRPVELASPSFFFIQRVVGVFTN